MWANQTDQSKTAVLARAAKLYDTTVGIAEANAYAPGDNCRVRHSLASARRTTAGSFAITVKYARASESITESQYGTHHLGLCCAEP